MRLQVHACCASGLQLHGLSTFAGLGSLLLFFGLLGCAGGEDFSKPPAQIQSQLRNIAAEQNSASGNKSAMPDADTELADTESRDAEVRTPDSMEKSPSAANSEEEERGKAAELSTSSPNVPPGTGEETEAGESNVATPGDDGTMTASGRSAEAIAATKAANSGKSVMGNAGGLLGSLKGSAAKPIANAPAALPASDSDGTGVVSRFGRSALSGIQWLHLVSQLTRQFFVASTLDGSRLAGSSGERSLEVLDTQLDVRNRASTGNLAKQISSAPIHVPVTSLPGIINSLELTNDGKRILIGTTDGRLLVRSAANTGDWDLFARDLFLFQDEHRRAARLSDTAIVAIRCLPNSQLLTIDANSTCAFWKMEEAVLPVTPILEMTIEQARTMEAETVSVTPVASFPISGFQVLSITIADAQTLGAIVTSSEDVFVFRTDTGELVETLNAEHFADTQPVCVEFIADGTEILSGLADGRILRRALSGTAPVAGVDDHGDPVDYEMVFVPDVLDHVSSITSLRAIPNSRTIYFGTIDGTVVRFDTASKRIGQSEKRHSAPVIEVLATPCGMLSIGGDRQVQLFDVPLRPQSGGQDSEATFQLPQDETLNETIGDGRPSPNASNSGTAKPTRPVRRRIPEKPQVDLSLAGLRPADATLALYNHQLRTSTDPSQTLEIRKLILRHQGANSLADSLGKEPAEVSAGEPLRAGEIATQMQFEAGSWSRVLLAISDDGTTVAAMHRGPSDPSGPRAIAKALSLLDMTTGTALRHWTQHGPARSLRLNSRNHVVIADPCTTHYWNATGLAETNPLRPVASSAASVDLKYLFLGSAGRVGLVEPALTRITLSDRSELTGVELFESRITAMALSGTGEHLYVGTRERDQVRLLDVDPTTLSIQQEIFRHPFNGRIPVDTKDESLEPTSGTVLILPSPTDKLMLTWGFYDGGEKLLLWKRSGAGWPQESMTVINAPGSSPDLEAIDQPVTFINQQDSRIAIVTATAVVTLNTRKAEIEQLVPIPAVSGHRPPCVFSPDGKWLLIGDGEGNIWAGSLVNLDRKPISFRAHTGPIAGLAMSSNGRFLVTIGEDSLMRSWRVDGFLMR